VAFHSRQGMVHAVDGISLRVRRRRTVALVGESGCGKSATALSVLRLIPTSTGGPTGGQIIFRDGATRVDLLGLGLAALQRIRGNRIAMIFQEPMTALNPVYSVGEQIAEVIELHQGAGRRAAWSATVEMLRRVGIPDAPRRAGDYPHQFSGGMRQRAMIAMALACRPALLIADEPTTALDPTIQQQILRLLDELKQELGMSILLISHDLGVVGQVADEVYVMYAGRIVEHGPVADVLNRPLHPYTQALLRCTPRGSRTGERAARSTRLPTIPGMVPDAADPPSGCRFHPRCALTAERAVGAGRGALAVKSEFGAAVLRRCVERFDEEPSGQPALVEKASGHFVACWEAERAT